MNKLLLYILALCPFTMWGQNHPIEYYFTIEVSTKDSLIMYAKEFLELSGNTYRYVGDEEKGNRDTKYLVFDRNNESCDNHAVKAYVSFGRHRLPDRVENGLVFYDDVDVEKRKYEYKIGRYVGEFEDMYTIWSKYIDPENADREQLRSNGYVRGPGKKILNVPGIYCERENSSGNGIWTFKFSISELSALDITYHSIDAWPY